MSKAPRPTNAENEEWRVIGDGYLVSDQGRLWSPKKGGHFITPNPNTSGGYAATTIMDEDGGQWGTYIHHLVWEAFVGPRTKGMHICHINGDGMDNRLENLREDTLESNMHDRAVQGRWDGPCISILHAAEIRERVLGHGESIADVAGAYEVGTNAVYRIVKGWTHSGRSKSLVFTDDQVREIRYAHETGVSINKLAKGYGVSWTTVKRAINGETYGWVA